jgi:hypothetical protein
LTGEKHKNRHKSKADLFEKTETTSASSRRLLASRRQHKAGPTFSSQKHHAKKKSWEEWREPTAAELVLLIDHELVWSVVNKQRKQK